MSRLLASTATTLDQNKFILHAAAKGLGYDLSYLPHMWPAGIALVFLLLMVRAKRRQDQKYRRARTGSRR
jgi:hypothetical protein